MQVRSRKKRIAAWVLNIFLFIFTYPLRVIDITKSNDRKDPSSFLIARIDHIGDVILSTPIYRSLKEAFPKAKIGILCGSWAEEILKTNPYIDYIIVLDCPWWTSIRNDSQKRRGQN